MFFLILGPSGVGKGTIIQHLKKKWESDPNFVFPITATTRHPRPQEQNGKDYWFMSKEAFEEGIQNNEFLEHAIVHKTDYYGLPKKEVLPALEQNKIVIRELDIQGLWSLQKVIPPEQIFSIFILPPSLEVLRQRILSRSQLSEEEVERRLQTAKQELSHANESDAQVISEQGGIEKAVEETVKIITSHI